jgi:energy-coupling factor transport system ATP-binding protein
LDAKARMKLFGWVEAHPEAAFFADTIHDEIAFGPKNLGLTGDDLDQKVVWALEMVGMNPEEYLKRSPWSLSGGEKRRVALASIIALDYPYYILDEPISGLDNPGRDQLKELLMKLKETGRGVLVITHDIDFLRGTVERLMGLHRGRLCLEADASNVDWNYLITEMQCGRMPFWE